MDIDVNITKKFNLSKIRKEHDELMLMSNYKPNHEDEKLNTQPNHEDEKLNTLPSLPSKEFLVKTSKSEYNQFTNKFVKEFLNLKSTLGKLSNKLLLSTKTNVITKKGKMLETTIMFPKKATKGNDPNWTNYDNSLKSQKTMDQFDRIAYIEKRKKNLMHRLDLKEEIEELKIKTSEYQNNSLVAESGHNKQTPSKSKKPNNDNNYIINLGVECNEGNENDSLYLIFI